MAENKYVADGKRMPVYMAATATAGDIIYMNTGSGSAGYNAGQFAGILDTSTVAGSYGVVETDGVFALIKGDVGQKIEQGQVLYGSSNTAVATAQVSTGSVIGVAWEQSAAASGSVNVLIHGMIAKEH